MEPWGPNAEVRSRSEAYADARRRLTGASHNAERALAESAGEQVMARIAAEERAAMDAAYAAQKDLDYAVQSHPQQRFAKILDESERVNAPKLSYWQWFQQNPSLLTAVPKTDVQRTEDARVAFILRRIKEEQGKFDPGSPFEWDAARDDTKDYYTRASAGVSDAELQGMDSPYVYRAPFSDGAGGYAPLYDRETGHYPAALDAASIGAAAVAPLSYVAYPAAENIVSPLVGAGNQLARGNLTAAGEIASRLPLAALNPAYDRAAEGSEYDWRGAAGPGLSKWLPRAAMAASFLAKPPRLPVADRIRRVSPQAIKAAHRAASLRHHPDRGGSLEVMKRINEAASMNDIETLLRYAR